jgi:hypothetical protein
MICSLRSLSMSTICKGQCTAKITITILRNLRIITILEDLVKSLGSSDARSISFQEITLKLRKIFHLCCGDYSGAVAVRNSFFTYEKMAQSDLRDWKELRIQKQSAISGDSRNPLDVPSELKRPSGSSERTIKGFQVDPGHESIHRLVKEAPREIEEKHDHDQSV